MDIDKFQKLIEDTYLKKDAKRGLPKTFMWFTEEVGELSRALRENNKEELEKEFADVLAWLFSLASLSGIRIEETIKEGSGKKKVAIISIKGILSSESAEGLFIEKPGIVEVVKQQLEQASTDTHVKAVLLEGDSPGGGITASDII